LFNQEVMVIADIATYASRKLCDHNATDALLGETMCESGTRVEEAGRRGKQSDKQTKARASCGRRKLTFA
jgi:hypothetical protein